MDVFSSVKELNTLLKEKNRLLIKRMLDFYLKVTIDKNWYTQNFEFLSKKSSSPGQFLRSTNWRRYI